MRDVTPSWFRNLTLSRKFFVSCCALLGLLSLTLAAGLFYLSKINSYVDRHQRITVPAVVTAATIQRTALEAMLVLHRFLERPGTQRAEDARERLDELMAAATRDFELYRSRHAARTHPILYGMLVEHGQVALADQEDAALTDIGGLLPSLPSLWHPLLTPSKTRASAKHERLTAEIDARMGRLTQALQVLVDAHTKIDIEMKKEGDRLVGRARLLTLGLVLLLGLVIAGTYRLVTKQIARPLTDLAFTADRVARQDLSAAFEPWPSQDEVGALTRSLHTMLGTLRERTGALERKTKELEGFSYSVAHDLKSPLREIEGFSSLLEQQYGSLLDPTARHYVTTIRTSALRLSALIDDLLRYARLEQQALPRTTVNLKALTDGVLADRAREVDAIGAQIRVEVPPATVPGDPTSLRQTLLNLVDNALKFARHATPPEITIGGSRTPTEYVLWVRDNGIGFDPRDAERIFGLFERLHGAQDYEGTGVGLAIVKLVMEKHRGRAWAESSPGKGSTFYVAFPTQHMSQGSSEH